VNPSFSSQEPRRPRFSFFNLHNVKELTFTPQGQNVGEAIASDFFPQNKPTIRLPGSKSALSEVAVSGNNLKSFASSAPRFLEDPKITVNRCFRFSFRFALACRGEFEVTFKSDCSFFSVACRSLFRRLAPRSAAVSGVIGTTFRAVNPHFQTP
ncbi:hypothetical protein, partial [Devosia sp.]|uniref:hypothetical protein n=1 Tax=Devosia sp. TaxID=1871048 RepID=UPI001AD04EAA